MDHANFKTVELGIVTIGTYAYAVVAAVVVARGLGRKNVMLKNKRIQFNYESHEPCLINNIGLKYVSK